MHERTLSPTASAVVESLQQRMRTLPPGSRAAEATEQAVTYALSDARRTDNAVYLEYDVLRDAYKAVDRSNRLQQRLVDEIAAYTAPSGSNRIGVHVRRGTSGHTFGPDLQRPGVQGGGGGGGTLAGTSIVAPLTPEDHAVAADLSARMRETIRRDLGAPAVRVFDSMLDGDTVVESAQAMGVSGSTIDRCRSKIRSRLAGHLAGSGVVAA